jgi:hypothetical protein
MLKGVKAFENSEGRVLARPPETLDQRAGLARQRPGRQRFGTSYTFPGNGAFQGSSAAET